ncbi:MAG: hypothetical protein ACHP6J_02640 [Burkholderiales bacterium]
MNKKQFRRLKGWIDYERKYLPSLTVDQRIDYFEKRLKLVLLVPLEHMYRDLMKDKRSSPLLCFSTCICCAIEALGKFLTGNTGRNGAGTRFRKFVDEFMVPQFTTKAFNGKRYIDLLWDHFRNGLAHGFTIKQGGFEHYTSYFQEKSIDGFKQLEIDPTHFFEDFKQAISQYIKRLRASLPTNTVRKNFNKAFMDLYINGL